VYTSKTHKGETNVFIESGESCAVLPFLLLGVSSASRDEFGGNFFFNACLSLDSV
jgi:hypothetical protein